jgi:ADP-ribosylglycohydrolase
MDHLPYDHKSRMIRVDLAIEGLSIGDALGEQFVRPSRRLLVKYRQTPVGPWPYTDDTEMALAIVETLDCHGHIEQDFLAARFAERFCRRPNRGYGAGAGKLLSSMSCGEPWQSASRSLFDGEGSMGNGGAMRAAPIGAYFADDLSATIEHARRSAEVTHAHPEGIAGAIAVAVAAGWACRTRELSSITKGLLETVLDTLPAGDVRIGVERARNLRQETRLERVVGILGNGSRVVARDTVPFCLWCAERNIGSYVDALWTAFSAHGDIDTNGAIVGGIVALATGQDQIPVDWRKSREPLS